MQPASLPPRLPQAPRIGGRNGRSGAVQSSKTHSVKAVARRIRGKTCNPVEGALGRTDRCSWSPSVQCRVKASGRGLQQPEHREFAPTC